MAAGRGFCLAGHRHSDGFYPILLAAIGDVPSPGWRALAVGGLTVFAGICAALVRQETLAQRRSPLNSNPENEAFVMKNYSLQSGLMTCGTVLLAILCTTARARSASPAAQAAPTSSADAAIPAAELLQPKELVQLLRSSSGEEPLILQVGSHVLYAEAHIPGSEYAGAAGQEAGLQALRDRVKELKRNRLLVIYCGCCPWSKCPNIRPAYQQLHALGFTRVKVLYLADNFGVNWVNEGYPIAKGR